MNQSGRPKKLKLWKHSVTAEKKPKLSKKNSFKQNVSAGSEDLNSSVKKNNLSKNTFTTPQNIQQQNLKRKNEAETFSSNKKVKFAKDSGEEGFIKQEQINGGQAGNNSILKKRKPDDLTRKEWKILHLDKKPKDHKEPNQANSTEQVPTTKKEWKEKKMKAKGKGNIFDAGEQLKTLWEELRRQDCKPERKNQLLKQVCSLIKGRVKEFTFAHDTVRVLESVFGLGAETHRALLLDELKDDFVHLAKSKYGKFFLLKVLRHGSKQQKDTVMKALQGKIIKLIKHSEAAEVVELAFNECANACQRFEMIQEFFGPNYKFFKVTDVHSLDQLIEANPEKKPNIIKNMKEELMKVLDKSVVKHSIVHHVLWQFMKHTDALSRSDIIESLREIVPEILHTKDGSQVGMHCVWHGSIKDRKYIVKSMKKYVSKIAMEEHGHMVLLAIFDAVDDTRLVEKNIIHELCKNSLEISDNVHGKKVLIYLLSPRDSHYIHPDVLNKLKAGDDNEISKKTAVIRQTELKMMTAQPLLKMISSSIKDHITNNAFCLFTATVLQHAIGDKKGAYESIANLLLEPYTSENKNSHPIERGGSNFMLKQLLIQDQASNADSTFSEVLIERAPKGVFTTWVNCNRGAFLLVSLIETKIPCVVSRVKEELEGQKHLLKKKNFKGAEILLKKLKE